MSLIGHDLAIVDAYAPSEDEKDKFYDLTDLIEGIGSRKELVLLRDRTGRSQ